jgi:hypothetical protein
MRSPLQSRPNPPVHRGARCAPVAVGGCVRCIGDVGAGTRPSTHGDVHSRRAAHGPGSRGNPHPSGAYRASTVVGVRAGSPAHYRSAAREFAGTAGNSSRRLHTAGTAWLPPGRITPSRHARFVRSKSIEDQYLMGAGAPGHLGTCRGQTLPLPEQELLSLLLPVFPHHDRCHPTAQSDAEGDVPLPPSAAHLVYKHNTFTVTLGDPGGATSGKQDRADFGKRLRP